MQKKLEKEKIAARFFFYFLEKRETVHHYCPRIASTFLRRLTENSIYSSASRLLSSLQFELEITVPSCLGNFSSSHVGCREDHVTVQHSTNDDFSFGSIAKLEPGVFRICCSQRTNRSPNTQKEILTLSYAHVLKNVCALYCSFHHDHQTAYAHCSAILYLQSH